MKKHGKGKVSKSSVKGSAVSEPELPNLVSVMGRLVERIENVERKMDQVFGRVSNLPQELWTMVQQVQRPNAPHSTPVPPRSPQTSPNQPRPAHQGPAHHHNQQAPAQNNKHRERPMYKVVCADCKKECEIPFKPTGERPVYCKPCFAARKSGQGKRPSMPGNSFMPQKNAGFSQAPVSHQAQGHAKSAGGTAVMKAPKTKSSRSSGSKAKKKKK